MAENTKAGRPSKYHVSYCEKLIQHLSQGNSFESFGAVVMVCYDTLYEWASRYPEFSEAKEMGLTLNLKYMEDMAKAGMSGQLRRIKSERPILENGKPVYDNNGNVMMHREYEPTSFQYVPWIFTMKNRFPRLYRDRRDLTISGNQESPIAISHTAANMTPEEKLQEIMEIQKAMQAIEDRRAKP